MACRPVRAGYGASTDAGRPWVARTCGRARTTWEEQRMQAAVYTRYGPPDVLRLAEVDQPVPGPGQVRVKIHATAVTSSDCFIRAGVAAKAAQVAVTVDAVDRELLVAAAWLHDVGYS